MAGLVLVLAGSATSAMAQTANTKTTYTYDALDRITQVTDPSGLNTTYQYDGLSNPTSTTSPDSGVTARTFDAAGNVLTGTDAKGNTVTYTYDVQNRRLTATYADSTQNIAYSYDEPNNLTGCTTSYPIGHLTRVVENAVTTLFCYNAQGYVIQKSQTVNGHSDVTTYTRSPAGRLLSITHPSGNQVNYTYDADGRVSGVTATTGSGTTTLVSNVSYLPFGPVSGYTLGNGQAITRTYDANYRLTDLVSPAFTLHVARDAMGDITAIGNSAGANPATETYSYDPLYRLTAIKEADGSTLESVTYNQTGDRLSKAGSGLATGTYSYNTDTHQLIATGNAARTVDADGNTTAVSQAGSTYGFGYNARNRMALAQLNQSTIANYAYNADGDRIAKTANGSTERYNYDDDSQLLSEYGATNREYVYLDDIPVANLDTQGTTTSIAYVTADQLGTPRAVTDGSGNTLWAWAYQGNAWGEQAPTSSGYTYNLRFPGQYFDVETGLLHNGFRDYCPECGRYIQTDPIGQTGGPSTYAYVGSSPLSNIDPLGLYPLPSPGTPLPSPSPAPSPAPGTGTVPNYGPPANEPNFEPDAPGSGLDGLAMRACVAQPELCIVVGSLWPTDAGKPGDETKPGGDSNVVPFPGDRRRPNNTCPQQDDDGDGDDRCEKNLKRDLATCKSMGKRGGKQAYEVCRQQAMLRYSNCLSGRDSDIDAPLPPWR
jgi:RHS repeat-associated protein